MADASVDSNARAKGLLLLLLAYLIAGLAGCIVAWAASGQSLYLALALGNVVATLVLFGFGAVLRNTSFYDLYWMLGPMCTAVGLFRFAPHEGASPVRRVLVLTLILAWGARLIWNWLRAWGGVRDEDWRYGALRERMGKRFWASSLFGVHLLRSLILYLACLSFFPSLAAGRDNLNLLDIVASALTIAAIVIETVADEQLRRFRRLNRGSGRVMGDGLWSLSRHPNYLGEIMLWWGLCLFGVAAEASSWWTMIGPIAVTAFIALVSARVSDWRLSAKLPRYAEHMKSVPAFVPRLFRG